MSIREEFVKLYKGDDYKKVKRFFLENLDNRSLAPIINEIIEKGEYNYSYGKVRNYDSAEHKVKNLIFNEMLKAVSSFKKTSSIYEFAIENDAEVYKDLYFDDMSRIYLPFNIYCSILIYVDSDEGIGVLRGKNIPLIACFKSYFFNKNLDDLKSSLDDNEEFFDNHKQFSACTFWVDNVQENYFDKRKTRGLALIKSKELTFKDLVDMQNEDSKSKFLKGLEDFKDAIKRVIDVYENSEVVSYLINDIYEYLEDSQKD